ncbi:MAG: hypothetical protein R2734_08250 [Nocardioides sp.]
MFGPLLQTGAGLVERVLGGASSVRRRLARAGLDTSVHDFRVEQVTWGLVAFVVVAVLGVLRSFADPTRAWTSLLLCLLAFVLGVVARDQHLSGQVTRRERAILLSSPRSRSCSPWPSLPVRVRWRPSTASSTAAGRALPRPDPRARRHPHR